MKLLYLIYLIKKTPLSKFIYFLKSTKKKTQQNTFIILYDVILSFLKLNTAFLDYFYFNFYTKSFPERQQYLDTLSMYKFQSRVNDKKYISCFKNKILFYNTFQNHITRPYFVPNEENITDFKNWLIEHRPETIFCKSRTGQVGKGIEKVKITIEGNNISFGDISILEFHKKLVENNFFCETTIAQHDILNSFYPHSLNTIRAITYLDAHQNVHLLGTLLRMGVDNMVIDNFDAGGVSVMINTKTGVIEGPLYFKDPFKAFPNAHIHPTTKAKVTAVQLPFWDETIMFIKKLTKVVPSIRTVGWDIAITEKGPVLLEGNHNWDKTHWQKVSNQGMKTTLNTLQ